MPRATRFTGSLDSRVPVIARRIKERMTQLGLGEVGLAKRCRAIAPDLFGVELHVPRDRVSKILMNCKQHPGKNAAKVIAYRELQVLAAALDVSMEWLVGQHDSRDPVHWDVLADGRRVEHVLHLLAEYEERAGELLVWAEFLMCSLVMPEFMHAYHEARFSELSVLGLDEEKQQAVALFDQIGNARRKRLLGPSGDRGYRYRQLIFHSDLRKIAGGEEEYRGIAPGVRQSSLRHLARLVADLSMKIELTVVDDSRARGVRRALRDYQSLSVFGEEFSLWDYHTGTVAWSEHPRYVGAHRRMLAELEAHAMCRGGEETVELLRDLARTMGRSQDRIRIR